MKKEVSQSFPFTDVSSIPSRRMQLQFKRILEAYSFKPINAPEENDGPFNLEMFAQSQYCCL